MSKAFRAYDRNQQLLSRPDLRQWLRDDHLALYVSDVVEALDLSAIMKTSTRKATSWTAALSPGADGQAVGNRSIKRRKTKN